MYSSINSFENLERKKFLKTILVRKFSAKNSPKNFYNSGPCTMFLYDKGGTIQQAGCKLPGDRFRWLNY